MGGICRKRFNRDFKMLILGIEGSGKTKLLYQLKYGKNVLTIPTLGFNVEIISIDDAKFLTFDLGRFDTGSHKEFYQGTDIVMFVVDSADDSRFYEAKLRIHTVMDDNDLADSHLIVVANKQDLNDALPTKDLVVKLGLKDIKQNWSMFSSVANFVKDTKITEIMQEEHLIIDIKNYLLSYVLDNFYYKKNDEVNQVNDLRV
jgi:GTPase SAR1 family protein